MEETKKKRVLIIEDEETNLLVGAMLIEIEESGCFEPENPGVVESPNQALECIRKYDSVSIPNFTEPVFGDLFGKVFNKI